MALVALVAVNCAAGRLFSPHLTYHVLPTADVLALASLIDRSGRRRFIWGFQAGGFFALACGTVLWWRKVERKYLQLVLLPYVIQFGASMTPALATLGDVLGALMIAIPQLAVAVVGGILLRRFGPRRLERLDLMAVLDRDLHWPWHDKG
jgi:hypothetical protein